MNQLPPPDEDTIIREFTNRFKFVSGDRVVSMPVQVAQYLYLKKKRQEALIPAKAIEEQLKSLESDIGVFLEQIEDCKIDIRNLTFAEKEMFGSGGKLQWSKRYITSCSRGIIKEHLLEFLSRFSPDLTAENRKVFSEAFTNSLWNTLDEKQASNGRNFKLELRESTKKRKIDDL